MRRIRAVTIGLLIVCFSIGSAAVIDRNANDTKPDPFKKEILETTLATEPEPTTTTVQIVQTQATDPVVAQIQAPAPKPPTTTTTAPRAQPAPPGTGPTDEQLAQLRQCESGGNYQANTGNGYYGAYQFLPSTWRSMGTGYDMPHEAPPAVQDDAARRLIIRSGWSQFPGCARKMGMR